MRLLDRIGIEIDGDGVLKTSHGLGERIGDILAEMVEESYQLIEAKALYDFYRIRDRKKGILILENGVTFESPLLAEKLHCADRVSVFISTLGPRLEARASEYFSRGEYLKGWVLDNVGTYALKKTNQYLCNIIMEEIGEGILSRFSPGHNYWDISQQRILFQLLPAERIGVKLTEHLMMVPKKSTSGIFGSTEKRFSSCQICPLWKRCEWRDEEVLGIGVEEGHP